MNRTKVAIIIALLNIAGVALLLFLLLIAGFQSFSQNTSDQRESIESLLFVFNPFLGGCLKEGPSALGRGAAIVVLWASCIGYILSIMLFRVKVFEIVAHGREPRNDYCIQNRQNKPLRPTDK
ncbi:hypothetical protein [Roseibacillus ishigakijimensis]|nr:hypothetical protein [Roseibacillus ishigakijimensis]